MEVADVLQKQEEPDWFTRVAEYISQGGNIEATNGNWTLLHAAAEQQHLDVIQLLADHGANLNPRAQNGWTPLHLAVDIDLIVITQGDKSKPLATASLLIQLGADQTIKNDNGETPRDIAKAYGEKLLLLYDRAVEKHTPQ